MKKITSMLAAACIALPAAAAAPDWGPADTIACYNVGPGMEYTKILYPDMPLLIWYCTIDLTNEYNKIEQVQSNHIGARREPLGHRNALQGKFPTGS